jgi:hypothetical protein
MTEYVFKTPTVREGPAGGHRLFHFYKLDKGLTVIKNNGTYSITRYLLDDQLDDYQEIYLGGRNHVVSEATKAALIAGGIGVTEANFTAI